jgi:hypothetical protein
VSDVCGVRLSEVAALDAQPELKVEVDIVSTEYV